MCFKQPFVKSSLPCFLNTVSFRKYLKCLMSYVQQEIVSVEFLEGHWKKKTMSSYSCLIIFMGWNSRHWWFSGRLFTCHMLNAWVRFPETECRASLMSVPILGNHKNQRCIMKGIQYKVQYVPIWMGRADAFLFSTKGTTMWEWLHNGLRLTC